MVRQPNRLKVYVREDCGPCHLLLEDLASWIGDRPISVEVVDVDASEASRRRFGMKVPVLTTGDDRLLLSGRFDRLQLDRLFPAGS